MITTRFSKVEHDFYHLNLPFFQENSGKEEDSYRFVRFSAFARYWNKVVDDEVAGIRKDMKMTYKSVHMLQEYDKKFKKDSNAAALASVHRQNRDMRQKLRGPDLDAAPGKMSPCESYNGVKRASLEASHPFASNNDDD